jgi:dTDP-4-dehydrorhamnose reductase
MKRILIIGQNGQVSTYLQRALNGLATVLVANREQLDLSKPDEITDKLENFDVDLIINPAAYTAVDLAEQERDLAYTVNHDAVRQLATVAVTRQIPLIHFSTDYVFSGDAKKPYTECDATGPTGVYGASKLAGEQAILDSGAPAIILRTAWVYSNHGKNFYKTMLTLAQNRDELSVVADQVGAPTFAGNIAENCAQLALKILDQGGIPESQRGIYHFTCQGQTSWHGFAQQIFELHNNQKIVVHPITTSDFPTPARRPAYSVLDNQRLLDTFALRLPSWQEGLKACVAETLSKT